MEEGLESVDCALEELEPELPTFPHLLFVGSLTDSVVCFSRVLGLATERSPSPSDPLRLCSGEGTDVVDSVLCFRGPLIG